MLFKTAGGNKLAYHLLATQWLHGHSKLFIKAVVFELKIYK